ncbi:MAG: hypothetical protein E6I18_12740 [Chloroflexi bacterium]|nr:MAG: hypothetical protein E6I18_12740 [Chloroflexota bacterium]
MRFRWEALRSLALFLTVTLLCVTFRFDARGADGSPRIASPQVAFARGPLADPLISGGVPAFTNDDCGGAYPAARANDDDYGTQWRSCNATPSPSRPVWLAYDLSSVAAEHRGKVLAVWYNDPATSPYDHRLINDVGYNIPATYSLEANSAPGGAVPGTGWVQLAAVSGNSYHSRQHLVDLTRSNWLRMSVSASDGSSQNFNVSLNLDLHDASAGADDDWIFYGDSITQDGMSHDPLQGLGGGGTWAQLIRASNPGHFPIAEDAGVGGFVSGDGATRLSTWLQLFAAGNRSELLRQLCLDGPGGPRRGQGPNRADGPVGTDSERASQWPRVEPADPEALLKLLAGRARPGSLVLLREQPVAHLRG